MQQALTVKCVCHASSHEHLHSGAQPSFDLGQRVLIACTGGTLIGPLSPTTGGGACFAQLSSYHACRQCHGHGCSAMFLDPLTACTSLTLP